MAGLFEKDIRLILRNKQMVIVGCLYGTHDEFFGKY